MEKTFQLDVVTPDRVLLSARVRSVILPAHLGYLGVLPGHAPFLCLLSPGVMRIDLEVPEEESRTRPGWEEQYRQYMAVGGGFAEVTPEHVTVLADSAEKPDEIDIKRAEAARQRAIKRVRSSDEDIDMERAELALRRALTRLRVAARYSRRRTR